MSLAISDENVADRDLFRITLLFDNLLGYLRLEGWRAHDNPGLPLPVEHNYKL